MAFMKRNKAIGHLMHLKSFQCTMMRTSFVNGVALLRLASFSVDDSHEQGLFHD